MYMSRLRGNMHDPFPFRRGLPIALRNLEQPLPNPLTVRMPFDELRNVVINGDDDVPEQQQELFLQQEMI
jgi:hypothetical protein